MIIILTILTICFVVIAKLNEWNENWIYHTGIVGSTICCFIDAFVLIVVIAIYVNGACAKDKIEMYQEENTKIEEQIETLVKQYMEYEGKTLTEFKSESYITLINLYPELKSDELITKQMEIYIENNNNIKQLKEHEIEMKTGKWLLYFGN